MPIPIKDSDPESHRSRYLPVAPKAFKEDRIYYPDTKVLLSQVEKDSWEILPEVRDELAEYFRTEGSKRIGSILSMRLKTERANGKSTTWGVINIHSNLNNGMDQGMIHSYIHIARPIFELIKDLLIIR